MSGVTFAFGTKSSVWDALSIGGVIGKAVSCGVYGCEASDVEMTLIEPVRANFLLSLGGMMGSATSSIVADFTSEGLLSKAKDVAWMLPAAQAEDKVVAGAMIGNLGSVAYEDRCIVENVTYQIGENSAVAVTDLLGKTKP